MDVAGWLKEAGNAIVDLLIPPSCALCSDALTAPATRPFLCAECRESLTPTEVLRCPRCAARIGLATTLEERCALCRDARLKFDRVMTLGSYDESLRQAVLHMKRWRKENLSTAIAELLVEKLHSELVTLPIDVIVPVPMHWRRRFMRVTNSAEIVAQTVAADLRVPYSRRVLRRRRATKPQASLSPGQRRRNVRDAFRVARGSDWSGANVLVVDDILTTGATCSEIAAVVKRAGAVAVNVLVVARAQGKL
jgi:ComF family protein